jgi:hypothetical protein
MHCGWIFGRCCIVGLTVKLPTKMNLLDPSDWRRFRAGIPMIATLFLTGCVGNEADIAVPSQIEAHDEEEAVSN